MTEEGFLEEEEGYIDWECDECKSCERVAFHAIHKKEKDIEEKWLCVGKIIRPNNPKNLHDAMNQVRFCIADLSTENESKQWSWTPYEALTVSTILQHGVRAILNDQHDDEFQKLKNSLSTAEVSE